MSNFVVYLEYKKLHESDLFKYAQINSSRKWELTASIAKLQVYDKFHLIFTDCILGYENYSQSEYIHVLSLNGSLFYN